MNKIILCFFFFLCFFLSPIQKVEAQDAYIHSIGLRAGPMAGISYKRFIFIPSGVIEGIAGFNFTNGRFYQLTGLYEHHFFMSYRLNFYAGAGLSFLGNNKKVDLAGDVIIGLEYCVENFPINFSLDYKPAYRIFGKEIIYNEFGLSVRYIL